MMQPLICRKRKRSNVSAECATSFNLNLSLLGRSWRHLVEKTCSDAKTSHNISQNLNFRVEYILFRRLVAFLAQPSGQKNTFFILWMWLQLAIIQKSVQNPTTQIIVVKDKEKQQNLTFKNLETLRYLCLRNKIYWLTIRCIGKDRADKIRT